MRRSTQRREPWRERNPPADPARYRDAERVARAALRLYALTAGAVARTLRPEEREVVAHACRVAGLGATFGRGPARFTRPRR
jgi:hypothetical protein